MLDLVTDPIGDRQRRRLRWKHISATTTYPSDQLWLIDVILVDTTSGSVTINLPLARDMAGHVLYVKKLVAANTVTLDGNGSETIDGAATLAFTTANQTVCIGAGPGTAPPVTFTWKVL